MCEPQLFFTHTTTYYTLAWEIRNSLFAFESPSHFIFFLRGQLAANNYLLMLLTRYYARVFPPKYTTPHVECVKDINTSQFAQFPFTPSARRTINPKLKIFSFFFGICNDSLLSVGRKGFSYKLLHRRNLESFCITYKTGGNSQN